MTHLMMSLFLPTGSSIAVNLVSWTGFLPDEPISPSTGCPSYWNEGKAGGEKTVGPGPRGKEIAAFCSNFYYASWLGRRELRAFGRSCDSGWTLTLEPDAVPKYLKGAGSQNAFIYGHVRKLESRRPWLQRRKSGPKARAGPVFIHWFI